MELDARPYSSACSKSGAQTVLGGVERMKIKKLF
jgi:hypothetical protein